MNETVSYKRSPVKRCLVMALCLVFLLGLLGAHAEEVDLLRMAKLTKNVNLREEPNTGATILKLMPKGSSVTLLKIEGDWMYVQYGKVFGYMHRDYIEQDHVYATPAQDPQAADGAFRELSRGSRGEDVVYVQQVLTLLGYYAGVIDGVYGAQTAAAVTIFQAYHPLEVSGMVDLATHTLLFSGEAMQAPDQSATQGSATAQNMEVLRHGMSGQKVQLLQMRLVTLGYMAGEITGVYGVETAEAIRLFQADMGLKPDGLAGKQTQQALFGFELIMAGIE